MKSILAILAAAVVICGAAWATKVVLFDWFSLGNTLRKIDTCYDLRGAHHDLVIAERPAYQDCVKNRATLFLNEDYAESKDLAKTFLTLLSAILVTSVAFSEKVVDVNNAKLLPLAAIVGCWALLLVAIIACGTGLAFMSTIAGFAAYNPEFDYIKLEEKAVILFIGAGLAFVFALLALIVAGIASIVQKRIAIAALTRAV
jgi:hypothetical protein